MAEHFIITNRAISNSQNKHHISVNAEEYLRTDGKEEARDEVRYGSIKFESTEKDSPFQIELYEDFNEEELALYATDNILPSDKKLGSQRLIESLYAQGIETPKGTKRETLVYIHGYPSDLNSEVNVIKALHKHYVEPDHSPIQNIVLFSWPHRSQELKYRDANRDAEFSGYALARVVANLKDNFVRMFAKENKPMCAQPMHLLSHSKGNQVVASMIDGLRSMQQEMNSLFKEIFLIAADTGYDALESPHPLNNIIDLGERVHVYYHNNDTTLGLSELTKNAFNRLGRWGAKNTKDLPDDVYQADVSDIGDTETSNEQEKNHWYFYESQSVVTDITEVMNGEISIFADEY